ncbi:MAG: hypothetical protein C0392_09875 [Syntrophus sp. (in: bacteria)]|nr:hypothetical protein [Syntrophus sp. (in: bacteria)]
MKKAVLIVACLFMLSVTAPGFVTLVGCNWSSDAFAQDIRSETKKKQDEAKAKGEARSKGYKKGKGGSPKDDGYKDMDDDQREAYKKGYKKGQ